MCRLGPGPRARLGLRLEQDIVRDRAAARGFLVLHLYIFQVDCSSIIEHAKVIVRDNGLENGMSSLLILTVL